jgi:hypothetical protein
MICYEKGREEAVAKEKCEVKGWNFFFFFDYFLDSKYSSIFMCW